MAIRIAEGLGAEMGCLTVENHLAYIVGQLGLSGKVAIVCAGGAAGDLRTSATSVYLMGKSAHWLRPVIVAQVATALNIAFNLIAAWDLRLSPDIRARHAAVRGKLELDARYLAVDRMIGDVRHHLVEVAQEGRGLP